MFQEFLGGHTNLLIWPLIGLGIFVASFVLVILFVSIGLKDRQQLDRLAALPLADDDLASDVADAKMGEVIR